MLSIRKVIASAFGNVTAVRRQPLVSAFQSVHVEGRVHYNHDHVNTLMKARCVCVAARVDAHNPKSERTRKMNREEEEKKKEREGK